MQKDIRGLVKDYKQDNIELSKNHTNKFEALLQQEMHPKKTKKQHFRWLSIAASVILLIGLGIQFYPKETIKMMPDDRKEISLGSISPAFETIETYYKNSINLEISQLEMTDENKEMIDGYLSKIAELTKEYKSLTFELNKNGVNDATIDALIRNLQLRLQLLQRLKKQLKQLKNLNKTQNDTHII